MLLKFLVIFIFVVFVGAQHSTQIRIGAQTGSISGLYHAKVGAIGFCGVD